MLNSFSDHFSLFTFVFLNRFASHYQPNVALAPPSKSVDETTNKIQKETKSKTESNKSSVFATNTVTNTATNEEVEDFSTSTEDTFSESSVLSGKYVIINKERWLFADLKGNKVNHVYTQLLKE